MAVINVTIPQASTVRVMHALCKAYGITPESMAGAKEAILNFIKATVFNVESSEAQQAALTALVEPDTDGIAT